MSTTIYLDDSFEEDAESCVEEALAKAMLMDDKNPSVWDMFTSLRLTQGRSSDAQVALLQGVSLWLPATAQDDPTHDPTTTTTTTMDDAHQRLSPMQSNESVGPSVQPVSVDEVLQGGGQALAVAMALPLPLKLSVARHAIETGLYGIARRVLVHCVRWQDDGEAEVWYLLALSHHVEAETAEMEVSAAEERRACVLECVEQAIMLLERLLVDDSGEMCEDDKAAEWMVNERAMLRHCHEIRQAHAPEEDVDMEER